MAQCRCPRAMKAFSTLFRAVGLYVSLSGALNERYGDGGRSGFRRAASNRDLTRANNYRVCRINTRLCLPIHFHLPDLSCRLRWSTQHWREVYSREVRIPMFFWVVDSSAARPGRAALAKIQTGRCLAESIAAGADWCFRWCRVARDFVDRRSRLAHSWLP